MPLDEEGAKWSCEPCIRGHRSSKCQHFDRMMMKVPKAGRPLARCPHPKGTCSCQKTYAFMIRIPKGSGCLCRPVYQVPADASGSVSSSPVASMPMPSSAPNKVQKPGKRQIKTPPENLTKALNSIPEFGKQMAENEFLNRPIPYIPQNSELSKPYHAANQDLTALSGPAHHVFKNPSSEKLSERGSCCSRVSKPTVPTPAPEAQRSCCAKPESQPESGFSNAIKTTNSSESQSLSCSGNATPYSFSHPQVSNWQDFQTAKQAQAPMPLSQLPPFPASIPEYLSHYTPSSLGMSLPQSSNGTDLSQVLMPQPFSELTEHVNISSSAANDNDTIHECHCGDNCQCLGCASHPFNNTTRQHVREMGLLVALDDEESGIESPSSRQNSPLLGQQSMFTPLHLSFTGFSHPSDNVVQPLGTHPFNDQSVTPGNMSGGYTTPSTNYITSQHMMEPSEYYTLEYPVGLPSACSNITGSCQCGNDCTCEGCLTHSGHNGLAVAPMADEGHNWDHTNLADSARHGVMPGTSEMSTLESFLAPSPSML
ncbi:putative copper-activated transcription factor GRISEA [Aspergillus homomorphus CBS 101889]|uniref:Copper-fist domain-containing protein n=1 Tax=Aspergillus homomorphus (strain CBS 101889) TaxID=1450537 RepID=A0A395HH67_ASPHC|nr:hypothetical protein BO97DRAFT_265473 [Aspergillus homomorphus CBS 101889]RAL07167.1 hypothetical protein BO97DRAFT_265473 [Aspergillus homomorphus CBS 101889]